MVSFVTDYIQNTAAGYLKTGVTAAGTMAGNAVGGVGSLVENTGRSIGGGATSIAGSIGGVGGYINNYGEGIRNQFAADGPVGGGAAKKTAVKPGAPKKPPVPGIGQKALPGAGAKKALPAPGKPAGSTRPPVQARAPASKPAGTPKPAGVAASKVSNGKATISAVSRPALGAKGARPPGAANASTPKPATPKPASAGVKTAGARPQAGKISINPASRPKIGIAGK